MIVSKRWCVKLIFTLIIIFFSVFFLDNNIVNAKIIGALSLVYSLLTMVEIKQHKELLILFSIIFYINLSAYVLGILFQGNMFSAYQHQLWVSEYNAIYQKCFLISSAIFYLIMGISPKNDTDKLESLKSNDIRNQNVVVSYACVVVLLIIFMMGSTGSSVDGNYTSNTNPLYEYSIFFFAIAWKYGNQHIDVKIAWWGCAIYYIGFGVLTGDRSSSFMLILLIFLYHLRKINISKILVLMFLGIFAANIIAAYRSGGTWGTSVETALSRNLLSFFSETAGQSYYTGITIVYYKNYFQGNTILFLLNWILTLFTGSLVVNRENYLIEFLAQDFTHNNGGGLFQSHFYFLGGFIGVAIGTLLISIIIWYVFFRGKSGFCKMLKCIIPAMSFRWYLYSPITLFRACLINFFIIYIAISFFDSLFLKKI